MGRQRRPHRGHSLRGRALAAVAIWRDGCSGSHSSLGARGERGNSGPIASKRTCSLILSSTNSHVKMPTRIKSGFPRGRGERRSPISPHPSMMSTHDDIFSIFDRDEDPSPSFPTHPARSGPRTQVGLHDPPSVSEHYLYITYRLSAKVTAHRKGLRNRAKKSTVGPCELYPYTLQP
jgi:hypothetical protein